MADPLNLEDDHIAQGLAYLGAALLCLIPFLQAGQQLWPMQVGNIRWRFGAANALSSVLLLPFVGITLAALIARTARQTLVSRIIAGLSAFVALALLTSLALFALDAMELKSIMTSQMMAAFNATTFRVGAVTLIFAVAFGVLTILTLKGPRTAQRPRRAARRAEEPAGLIVGQELAE